jgi:hypothetical protein
LGDDRRFPFERDGVDEPAVVVRGDVYQMWYVGWSGARATIALAVSGDGQRWERWGAAFGADLTWESSSVAGPAPIYVASEEAGLERCLMWYHGGPRGRERIGLAERSVPAR